MTMNDPNVWDSTPRPAGAEWTGYEEYGAAVAAIELRKAAAEDAFRAALEAGRVLVEHWICGVEPSHHVWTGREVWHDPTHTTAEHVANRFRAGWTRVEIV